MKKLTAGIFTVLLGVVAANSADAALTSKAYVDAKVGAKVSTTDFNQFKTENTTAIADAKKAGTDAATALDTYKTENNAAVAKKADAETMTTELGKKQDKLVSTDAVVINADNTITLKNIASTGDITALQGKVDTNTANIEKNTGAITTLNGADTVENSVAYKIKNALTDYTTTADMNTKLDLKADKTAIEDMETKTNAAATYATKTEMNTVDGKFANYTNTTDMNKALDLKADKSTIGTVAAGKTVVGMIEDAKYNDTTVKADIQKNADAIATNTANIAKKQDTLTEKQLKAVNSGIDETKVTTYDGYDTRITTAQTQADKGVADAAAAKTVADKAIPKPDAACTTLGAKCVLTVGDSGYAWESVERATGEATGA